VNPKEIEVEEEGDCISMRIEKKLIEDSRIVKI